MLSPRKSRVILLPEDRELINLLGWEEDQYRYFVKQASTFNDIRPGEPTAFLIIPFLIKLTIGLALSYLGNLLTRRQSSANAPTQVSARNVDGQNIVSSGRYAPRAGFDSTQNVVEMGSVIPVVFAKREQINGVWYGGVRINTNLLWSQLFSQGTGQLLRAVFMISEGPIGALDPRQFAIGDNLLGSYDLETSGNTSGRISIYFRSGGGLIRSSDLIAGRAAANDEGNAETSGGNGVFDVRGVNQQYKNDFCYVSKPTNQTRFGLYAGAGNGLQYRINPVIRPASFPQLFPKGRNGDSRVSCNQDVQAKAEQLRQNALFSTRSGIVSVNGVASGIDQGYSVGVGETFVYVLSKSSDYDTLFKIQVSGPDGKARCVDAAQAVASRQRQWDDSIVVGELYKIGTAHAICVSRSPAGEVFVSEAENEPKGGGADIFATFRIVKSGTFSAAGTAIYESASAFVPIRTGTLTPHLLRMSISSFIVDRPTQIIEIGYKSTLGIRISGLMNFRDAESVQETNYQSCVRYGGDIIKQGKKFTTKNINSGTVSISERRYSFFRIGCRIAGSNNAFTELNINFGISSQTQQASYNYLRLQFPTTQRWEVRHIPISGWEVRANIYPHPLIVLDSRITGPARTGASNGFVFNYSGKVVARSPATFGLASTVPRRGSLGIGPRDAGSYVDAFGALAEIFNHDEIQSSASEPEHEIAYVNLISSNPAVPSYANIALAGVTLRSGPGFSELNQFSVYVNQGFGNVHLFPQCYAIALTNPAFGAGEVLSPAQIDFDSFDYSSTWNYNRRYFYDIGISNPQNLRSNGAETAKLFLLDLSTKNGKFHLSPVAEFGKQYVPTALFTSGNADSVNVSERDSQDRQPVRVSVKWREERQSDDAQGRGLFPVIREITVSEAGTPQNAPLVQIDMSEFATSELHAVDVGKMECRERRLITHDVNIECLPDRNALEPGAIIKVGMELLAYEQPNNGIILADGSTTATSGSALSDGSYNVVLWDGVGDLQEVTINVTGGKVVGYSSAVFCIADSVQTTQTFKTQVISYNDEGNLEITASYYPLDSNGYSLLLDGWDDPSAWVIEGLIGPLPPSIPLAPAFEAVIISGPLSVTQGSSLIYIAEIDGPAGTYSYSWSGAGVTFDSTTVQSPVVTFVSSGTAALNVTATRAEDGVSRSTSKSIEVTAIASNSISIAGPLTVVAGETISLTAVIAQAFTTVTYEWRLDPDSDSTLSTTTASLTELTATVTGEVTEYVYLTAIIDGIEYTTESKVEVTDPPLPTITLTVSPSSVAENSSTSIVFTFARTFQLDSELIVSYVIGGTATNSVDYATIGTSVTFGINSDIATVVVDPIVDSLVEPSETVSLTIVASPDYTVGTTSPVVATILESIQVASLSGVAAGRGNLVGSLLAEVPPTTLEITGESSVTINAPSLYAGVLTDSPVPDGDWSFAWSVISPPPPVIEVPVSGIIYSQSSLSSLSPGVAAATNANMTNGLYTDNATATNSVSNSVAEWVMIDLGAEYAIGTIVLGTPTSNVLPNFDYQALNVRQVRYRDPQVNYADPNPTFFQTTIAFETIGPLIVQNEGIITFSVNFTARYIFFGTGDNGQIVSLSEFYALAPGQVYP